jgi:hypothetical protein
MGSLENIDRMYSPHCNEYRYNTECYDREIESSRDEEVSREKCPPMQFPLQ